MAVGGLKQALHATNSSRAQIATAYSQLDAVFRDYLQELYPLEMLDEKVAASGYVAELDNDLLGDSLTPSHENAHQGQTVLAFLLFGLCLGLATVHILSRYAPTVPYTSVLFVEGVVLGMYHAGIQAESKTMLHRSILLWEQIDPHLLFFTFLPVLVFGDAMNMNFHMWKQCLTQVLWLAIPGVAIGALLTGLVAQYILPYSWDFSTSMAFGAILSATDPVAVVALFKTLGVAPRLTTLVQGESLLNDGTATVIFLLFQKITLGGTFTPRSVASFLGNMMGLGPIVGVLLGLLTVMWLGAARRKHDEGDGIIQVMLTVLCAYVTFFVAETTFATSGVLTCVSGATVLSAIGLARFNQPESIEIVWGVFEYTANTLIFLLAGLTVGKIIMERTDVITRMDYVCLLGLYVMLLVIRALVIFLSFPLLKVLGTGLTWQEAAVATWSGLRGAVGLALAIIMDIEPRISRETGTRVMFHVGGIAALTLLVNGSTTRYLLQYLGMGMTSALKQEMLQDLQTRMENRMRLDLKKFAETEALFIGADVRAVELALLPKEHAHAMHEVADPVEDPERLRFLRETYMQVVRKAYFELVSEGMLSGTSMVVQMLVGSTDEATETFHEKLKAWSVLRKRLDVADKVGWEILVTPAKIIPWLSAGEKARLATANETRVVAALSFIAAHEIAQVRVLSFFGTTDQADSPEEKVLVVESKEQVAEATKFLSTLPQEVVVWTRSRMLCAKLLESEAQTILHMNELGILNSKDSVDMLAQVDTMTNTATEVLQEHAYKTPSAGWNVRKVGGVG